MNNVKAHTISVGKVRCLQIMTVNIQEDSKINFKIEDNKKGNDSQEVQGQKQVQSQKQVRRQVQGKSKIENMSRTSPETSWKAKRMTSSCDFTSYRAYCPETKLA